MVGTDSASPSLSRGWRALSLLALPHLVFIGAHWAGAVDMGPFGLRLVGGGTWLWLALVAAALVVLAMAVAAESPPVRTFAYAIYAMALALGFGGGVVIGFLNAVGGVDGTARGPVWLTTLLGAGAAVSVASLLGLAMIVRADLMASTGDR